MLMLKRMMILTLIAIIFTPVGACGETGGEPRRVETTLENSFLRLNLNADVTPYEVGAPLPIYAADYATADDGAWREMFFGSADAQVIDEWEGWNLEEQQVYYPELEHFYTLGEVWTNYTAIEVRLNVVYRNVEFYTDWHNAQEDARAEGLEVTPEAVTATAQAWMAQLEAAIGWGGYELRGCYAMPASPSFQWDGPTPPPDPDPRPVLSTGVYVVEYHRVLYGIPVAMDSPPAMSIGDEVQWYSEGDGMRIYLDDEGIIKVDGYCRNFSERRTEKLAVSLDGAIEIVRENMDYTSFNSEIDDSEPDFFDITQIGLCYRLVRTLELYDVDVNARMEARPAWRFASAVNRNMTNEFVMFVDAITGEVLP